MQFSLPPRLPTAEGLLHAGQLAMPAAPVPVPATEISADPEALVVWVIQNRDGRPLSETLTGLEALDRGADPRRDSDERTAYYVAGTAIRDREWAQIVAESDASWAAYEAAAAAAARRYPYEMSAQILDPVRKAAWERNATATRRMVEFTCGPKPYYLFRKTLPRNATLAMAVREAKARGWKLVGDGLRLVVVGA